MGFVNELVNPVCVIAGWREPVSSRQPTTTQAPILRQADLLIPLEKLNVFARRS